MDAIQVDALIVAPWGNPYSWGSARYKYRGSEAEARTSLAALAASYSNPYILVIAADTVYAAQKGRSGCEPQSRAQGRPRNYRELVESVKRDIRAWVVVCSGSERLKRLLEKGRMVVEVVPGTGSYGAADGTQYRFVPGDEPAATYAGWAMGLILQALLKARPQRLIMDVTHGINYMPLALRRAVEAATLSYAAATGNTVSLEVVNSEPYPLGLSTAKLPRLKVWVVEEKRVEPGLARDQAALAVKQGLTSNTKMYTVNRELVKREAQDRIGRAASTLTKEAGIPAAKILTAAANIVLYSMPLAAAYLAAETAGGLLESLAALHESLRRLAVEHGVVVEDEDGVKAGPGLVLSAASMEPILYGSALLDAVHRAATGIRLGPIHRDGLDTESLARIAQGLGSLYDAIARYELSDLKRKCLGKNSAPEDEKRGERKEPREDECSLALGKLAWPGEPCDKKALDSLSPRNLRAHAGLERNITEAMVDEAGRLWLRYRLLDGRPLCWERLREKLGERF